MEIVWDEPKRLTNLARHGLDFADLDEAFFRDALIIPSRANRLTAVGRFGGGMITVIITTLGLEGISVISMRPASSRERRLYEQTAD